MYNSPSNSNNHTKTGAIGSSILNSAGQNMSGKMSASSANRLSYNDSCYFSSSSSSCASSFGSNHDDSQLAHLNWFKQDMQQQQPPQQSSLISSSKPSFYDEKQDELQQEAFTNQFIFKQPVSFYGKL